MEEKIVTLHPQGKNGVRINKNRYDQIKDQIMHLLQEQGAMTYQDLNNTIVKKLKDRFDGKIPWYVVTVKLDLEARGIIERVKNTYPHKLRIKSTA